MKFLWYTEYDLSNYETEVHLIRLATDYITLGQWLKLKSFTGSGGEAKAFLQENEISVNNEKENRRGRKLYPGDIVNINGTEFRIET
ncbi:MAG: S4 domain-containing protein YaaA [Erysipelotrichaceae bacterium]|nr:S4 domain-containing protein YaaA [Erysipelotrichaceae bacterium]